MAAVTSQEPSPSAPWPSTRGTGVKAAAQVIRAASAARSSGEPAGAHLTKYRSGPSPTSKVSAWSFSQARHTGRAAASCRTGAGGVAGRRGASVLTRSRCHTRAQPGAAPRRLHVAEQVANFHLTWRGCGVWCVGAPRAREGLSAAVSVDLLSASWAAADGEWPRDRDGAGRAVVPGGADVQGEGLFEGGGEGDVAVLGALALGDADPAGVEVDVAEADADEFGDPDAGVEQGFDEHDVAAAAGGPGRPPRRALVNR